MEDVGLDIAQIILMLAVVFILSKTLSRVVSRFGVPGLIGEIVLGVVLANLVIGDFDIAEMLDLKEHAEGHQVLEVFSELGVVFLLFMVGLETRVTDLTSVGKAAFLVAFMGVIVPFIVGFAYVSFFGDGEFYHSMFMGAAMVATSVGITARVIKDMGLMDVKESRIIIGAAVIDDILGMIVLAIVSGMAKSGGELDILNIVEITVIAVAFVLAVLFLAGKVVPAIHRKWLEYNARKMEEDPNHLPFRFNMFIVALALCLVFAYFADAIGLATIIGSFLGGMLFAEHAWEWKLEEKFENLSTFFVSYFFVYVGMNVDLQIFFDKPALLITAAIVIVLACLTKFIGCGLGAKIAEPHMEQSSVNIIGCGMMPRGEVGIIVALIGTKIIIDEVESITAVSDEMYAIIVLMCIATTIIAPPILSILYRKKYKTDYVVSDEDKL